MPICVVGALLALAPGCAQRQPTIARALFSIPDAIGPVEEAFQPVADTADDPIAEQADDTELRRQADIASDLERGASETRAGRYGQAAKFYERVLRDDPDHAEAHHRLAVLADLRGDFIAAERSYARVLEIRQDDPDLFNDLGYSYLLQERYAEAEQAIRQALALKADHTRALANLELLYRRIGDETRALAVAEAISSHKENSTTASFRPPTPVSTAAVTNVAGSTTSVALPDSSPLPLWTTESYEAVSNPFSSVPQLYSSSSAEPPSTRDAADDLLPIVLTGHVLPGSRDFPTDVLNTTAAAQLPPPRWQTPQQVSRAD